MRTENLSATASNQLYFAYGSNLWPPRLEQRVGPCRKRGIASLPGYHLRFHKRGQDGSGKGDAYRTDDRADFVIGALFELSARQCELLHGFEGRDYMPHDIIVRQDALELSVFTYLVVPQAIQPGLQPYSWYKDFVICGARYFEMPASYVQALVEQPAKQDPNPTRHEENRLILALSPD